MSPNSLKKPTNKPSLSAIVRAGKMWQYAAFFALVTGLLLAVYYLSPIAHWVHPKTHVLNALLVFLFIFAHYITSMGLATDQQNVFTHYAAGLVVRFLLSLSLLALYLVFFEFNQKKLLAINFVGLYLTYIFFEIIFLFRILHNDSEKDAKN